jgi:hypothetical protein
MLSPAKLAVSIGRPRSERWIDQACLASELKQRDIAKVADEFWMIFAMRQDQVLLHKL